MHNISSNGLLMDHYSTDVILRRRRNVLVLRYVNPDSRLNQITWTGITDCRGI